MKSYKLVAVLLTALGACSGDRDPAPTPPTTTQSQSGIACAALADCQSRGGACLQGRCTADNECASDQDCAAREICHADVDFGGLCAAPNATPLPGPAWSCAADADCPTGQLCTSGSCGPSAPPPPPPPPPPACTVDADCASAEICRADGVCVPDPWFCNTDADCPGRGNYICLNNQCGTATSQGCNGQNCPCDVIAQDCVAGLKCYPGGALTSEGQCYANGARLAGDSCTEPPVDGVDACVAGLLCVYASENAPSGSCAVICDEDSDCGPGGLCYHFEEPTLQWGACVAAPPPPPPPPCDAFAQDCPAGELCAPQDLGAHACVPAGSGLASSPCVHASSCSAGLACVAAAGSTPQTNYFTLLQAYIDRGGGDCKTLCRGAADCAPGESCAPILESNTGNTRGDVGVCD